MTGLSEKERADLRALAWPLQLPADMVALVEQIKADADRAARAEVDDLKSRLACVLEASHWDRGYEERLAAIRGMCDLSTNGMTSDVRADLQTRLERLEDVALRWDVPGGSPRLARRALDKADGIRVALRLLGGASS